MTLEKIETRIKEIATTLCANYPRLDVADTWELLRAIDYVGKGTLMACDDCHEKITELKANNRHVQNAINRICPDCGEDMGGESHDHCYKCECDNLKQILQGYLDLNESGCPMEADELIIQECYQLGMVGKEIQDDA